MNSSDNCSAAKKKTKADDISQNHNYSIEKTIFV